MSRNIFLFAVLFCGSLTAQVVIVNNASFRSDQPVAAGSWVAAFGVFSGVSTQTATNFPLPKTLASVRVSIDGTDAALFDVRSTQLTFLIPYSVEPGIRPVVISTPAGSINASIRVISAGPGIFTKDTQNPPRGAIRNQDGFTENAEATPTRRGDVVSIYATGPGALSRNVEDGAIPGATPLVNTKSTPQVFIGGVEAQVLFSGLNPDAPGLWQINVTVPNQSFVTGRVPVRIFMDGVDSNEVTLFVQ
jgi:uncharacterized protein (TIGR03437 family)